MAAIAFFVVVAGGSAYAAATIGAGDIKNDAVRSRHIKNGEVKNPDLGANSVGSAKVIDGSLLKRDFKAGQLPKGDTGATGPSFGETVDSFPLATVTTCTDTALIDKSITLSRSSRIFVNGLASMYANNTGAEIDLSVDLRSEDGKTTLASLDAKRMTPLTTEIQADTQGVLGVFNSGTTSYDPYVASAGTYHLVMHSDKSGACATSLTYSEDSLTWIELGTAAM
jgi:hypothetical protein